MGIFFIFFLLFCSWGGEALASGVTARSEERPIAWVVAFAKSLKLSSSGSSVGLTYAGSFLGQEVKEWMRDKKKYDRSALLFFYLDSDLCLKCIKNSTKESELFLSPAQWEQWKGDLMSWIEQINQVDNQVIIPLSRFFDDCENQTGAISIENKIDLILAIAQSLSTPKLRVSFYMVLCSLILLLVVVGHKISVKETEESLCYQAKYSEEDLDEETGAQ